MLIILCFITSFSFAGGKDYIFYSDVCGDTEGVMFLPSSILMNGVQVFISPINHPDWCPVCGAGTAKSKWDKELKARQCYKCNKYWINEIEARR